MVFFVIIVVALVATAPLTMWGVRLAKRYRGMASGAATLLLLFGTSVKIDPPPPPRVEAVQREQKEVDDDEPE